MKTLVLLGAMFFSLKSYSSWNSNPCYKKEHVLTDKCQVFKVAGNDIYTNEAEKTYGRFHSLGLIHRAIAKSSAFLKMAERIGLEEGPVNTLRYGRASYSNSNNENLSKLMTHLYAKKHLVELAREFKRSKMPTPEDLRSFSGTWGGVCASVIREVEAPVNYYKLFQDPSFLSKPLDELLAYRLEKEYRSRIILSDNGDSFWAAGILYTPFNLYSDRDNFFSVNLDSKTLDGKSYEIVPEPGTLKRKWPEEIDLSAYRSFKDYQEFFNNFDLPQYVLKGFVSRYGYGKFDRSEKSHISEASEKRVRKNGNHQNYKTHLRVSDSVVEGQKQIITKITYEDYSSGLGAQIVIYCGWYQRFAKQ